jgi:Uma2 family endonuclease
MTQTDSLAEKANQVLVATKAINVTDFPQTVIAPPRKIQLPPGAVLRMPATWDEYQALCDQRGDGSIPRIKFRDGEVVLMSPLPVHGKDANILSDVVKVILEYEGREYDAYTPVTMFLPEESGIEPDYCFYIDNWEAVVGKKRIDWANDPPPDLAIEIDVTSYSSVDDYLPYKVPELWMFKKSKLTIYGFVGDRYEIQSHSRFFPNLNLGEIIDRAVKIAYERNSSAALRDRRQQLAHPS